MSVDKSFYENELNAIKRSNRFRERKLFDESLIDMGSNDYLGLGEKKKILKKAYKKLKKYPSHAPKASMLVNGYHEVHKEFEQLLCKTNGFESGIVVGSGFLANISLIESLVRKKDIIFIDSDYHASGMLASKLIESQVVFFNHNDDKDLEKKLEKFSTNVNRIIIAIEGVYSMSGDIAPASIDQIAKKYGAILLVDEAHSSGVIGDNLLGWFEYHNIPIEANHIKMGTLGKAYGAYGAYILASDHIISYLQNRAKPIIYSTAPSIIETAVAMESLKYIIKHKDKLKKRIKTLQEITLLNTGIKTDSLIVSIVYGDNKKVLQLQKELKENNIFMGAIRQPTVPRAILRVILRTNIKPKKYKKLFKSLRLSNIQKFTNMVRSGLFAKAHELLEEDWLQFKRTGNKNMELFYKGVINGATSLELIKRKRSNEAIQKTWDCFLRHEHFLGHLDEELKKEFAEAINLLKNLKEI